MIPSFGRSGKIIENLECTCMEYRKLGNTGMEVLGGVFHPVNLEDCMATVRAALDGGINFPDVSPAYGEWY